MMSMRVHIALFVSLLLLTITNISGQYPPRWNEWNIPVELLTNDVQFRNDDYARVGIREVKIHFRQPGTGGYRIIVFDTMGWKQKSSNFSKKGVLIEQKDYTYTASDDSILATIRVNRYQGDSIAQSTKHEIVFVDSITEYNAFHPRKPSLYVRYDLHGIFMGWIDKTPKESKIENNHFSYGHGISKEPIYSKKGKLIKESVHEYDFVIVSTPEFSNDSHYQIRYRYNKFGFLKTVKKDAKPFIKISYSYF